MRIALAGNQNSGKTTLFNLLCGTNQKIGNWPGVTIEKKSGTWRGTNIEIVDLPGIYSLSAYSVDEEITLKAIFEEGIDLIINIVDATNLERSLYLTSQLLDLDIPLIVALNMADSLTKKGIEINVEQLEKLLGVNVFPISAKKNIGLLQLQQTIVNDTYKREHRPFKFEVSIENEISTVASLIKTPQPRFIALKSLEDDELFRYMRPVGVIEAEERLKKEFVVDAIELFATERYRLIKLITDQVVTRHPIKSSISNKLDRIFLNKYLALPIFGLIMFLVYFLSVGLVGGLTADYIEQFFGWASGHLNDYLASVGASGWALSLIEDGLLGGMVSLLQFVPQLIMLFILIALLETTGYIARISFFLDRLFYRLGLSGRSLIPFIVGSGCSVPGILATRTIENEDERKMTILLTPFVPCSAKLPIIALFSSFFFNQYQGLVSFLLYAFSIIVIIITALILKKVFHKSKAGTYISELPDYHWPHPKYLFIDVYEKTKEFVVRAGSIIILSSVALWFLASFSFSFKYISDPNQSILAQIGGLVSWLFYPMLGGNISWGAAVSAIQGLIAKENVVASMAVIAGVSNGSSGGEFIFASGGIFSFFTPITAIAFTIFNLFSAPCIAAILAMKKEFGTSKMMWRAVLFQTAIAYVLASLIGGIGTLIAQGGIL